VFPRSLGQLSAYDDGQHDGFGDEKWCAQGQEIPIPEEVQPAATAAAATTTTAAGRGWWTTDNAPNERHLTIRLQCQRSEWPAGQGEARPSVQHLQSGIPQQVQHQGASAHPHGRETLPVRRLRQGLSPEGAPAQTSTDTQENWA